MLSPRSRRSADDGFTMLMTLGTMVVVTAFLITTLTYVVSQLKPTGYDQAGKAAVAAAQAGIDDYISHLDVNATYFNNNNSDASNAALVSISNLTNPASTGIAVPGTTSTERYKYAVLSSVAQTASAGEVVLKSVGMATSSGKVVTRTLTATLAPHNFLQYVYFTNYEDLDPVLVTPALTQAQITQCTNYYYSTGTTSTTTGRYYTDSAHDQAPCVPIQFASADVISGPMHSNDALDIGGAVTFGGKTAETGWGSDLQNPNPNSQSPDPTSTSHLWYGAGTPSTNGVLPTYGGIIGLPSTNASLTTYASTPNVGCYYTGATKITFNSNGSVTILSPSSTTSATTSACYNKSTPTTATTLTTTPSVIYVANASGTCGAGSSTNSGVGYPVSGASLAADTSTYNCLNGDAYVSGTVNGQTTVAAANNIVVVGDTTYHDYTAGSTYSGTDTLGLIANNEVWVYNPVNSSNNNLLPSSQVVHTITAAIMSLSHSFVVENWSQGSALGTLNVYGTIIQNFRGPVATSDGNGGIYTGYAKNYMFDQRLQYDPPPYFLQPTSAPWAVTQLSDD